MAETTDVHTLAGAYALDALAEVERAGFERHTSACPSCAAEAGELTETAARLGAVTATAPPPGLRPAVLAEIARTRQVGAGRPDRTGPAGTAAQRWRRRAVAAVAAAVVALAGVAAVWTVEEHRVHDVGSQIAALREGQARVDAVLGAGDVEVRTTTVAGGGHVTVAVSPSADAAVVVMSDLPAPPTGHAYQLWLIRNSSPTPAGLFAAGARSGTAYLGPLGGAQRIGVTLEPAAGSSTPTRPIVAEVSLA